MNIAIAYNCNAWSNDAIARAIRSVGSDEIHTVFVLMANSMAPVPTEKTLKKYMQKIFNTIVNLIVIEDDPIDGGGWKLDCYVNVNPRPNIKYNNLLKSPKTITILNIETEDEYDWSS